MTKDSDISRSARRLRMLVLAGIVLIIAIYLLGRFAPEVGPVRVQSHATGSGWVGRALVDVTLALFVIALVQLARMLAAIAQGPVFGPRVTRAFRGFAFWLFLATLLDVVAEPALALLDAASAGGGTMRLVFELRDLLMLAGALFLFLLARMLERARFLESELEEIV